MPLVLKLEELRNEQRQIAEAIGIPAYLKLSAAFGGTNIYIAKADEIINRKQRDARIRKEFTGYNYTQLALKYGLTEAWVRNIVSDIANNVKNSPISGQLTFEDIGEE